MPRLPDAIMSHILFTPDREEANGRIATMWLDLDFTALRDPDAAGTDRPLYRVYGKSPRGALIEIGAIWERLNRHREPYLAISISDTGIKDRSFSGNIGRLPGGSHDDLRQGIMENRHSGANGTSRSDRDAA